ncbi:hypothetical protein BJF81_04710 [Ornithinimicrobium sp. CNJ-824]|nr:hypothetical protein BJF81_04710 [Ornithinimicrobium sp. CNJ-824]
MQHQLVGVALLVEQDELLTPLHLVRCQCQQLLGGGDAAAQQPVRIPRSGHPGGETALEEIDELTPVPPAEHPRRPRGVGDGHAPQVCDAQAGGVVQVCRAGELVLVLGLRDERS